jgi:hypothetical protein
VPQHPTAQIVADFYSARGSADADTLAAFIDAPDGPVAELDSIRNRQLSL